MASPIRFPLIRILVLALATAAGTAPAAVSRPVWQNSHPPPPAHPPQKKSAPAIDHCNHATPRTITASARPAADALAGPILTVGRKRTSPATHLRTDERPSHPGRPQVS